MKKVFLSLITIFMVLSLSVVLVKASETTIAIENGAQIRTDGNNGLRWQATVTNPVEGQTYGFLFAQGDLETVTVETANVINEKVTELKDDNTFAATMVKFPKSAATQDISVVAYVCTDVEDPATYKYSSVVVRNLSEVAVEAYEVKGLTEGFVKSVYDASETTFVTGEGQLKGDYQIIVTNYETSTDGSCVGIERKDNKNKAMGTYWYRVALKYNEEVKAYQVVATYDSGVVSSSYIDDYDYMVGVWESNNKTDETEIKKILSLDDPTSLFVDFDIPQETGNCYIALNFFYDVELTNYSDHLGGSEELPKAYKSYYDFAGWYNNQEFAGETILKQGKDRTLYAKYTPTNYKITYEIGDGSWDSEYTPVSSYNYESEEIILPTAENLSIEGGNFVGWYDNSTGQGDAITKISKNSHGDLILYAIWEMDKAVEVELTDADKKALSLYTPTKFVNPIFTAGKFMINDVEYDTVGGTLFTSLNAAFAQAVDNDVIYVFANDTSYTYTKSDGFTEEVVLVGPNAGVSADGERSKEATITSDGSYLYNDYISFVGLKLKMTNSSTGNFTYTTSNVKHMKFIDCYITQMNTLIRATSSYGSNQEFTIENCKIDNVGQFLIQGQYAVKTLNLIGNYVTSCGQVENSGAGFIRMESTAGNPVVNVYNNYFDGNLKKSVNTLFRMNAGSMAVKYNTFKNVSQYIYGSNTNEIKFNSNLYLDAEGNTLNSVPNEVKGTAVVADYSVCASESDRSARYQEFLNDAIPTYKVTYELNGGSVATDLVTSFEKYEGLLELPEPTKGGYTFLGWTIEAESTEYITAISASTNSDVTLYAQWKEGEVAPVVVELTEADLAALESLNATKVVNSTFESGKYSINDVIYVFGENAFADVATALANASENDTIYVFAGTYDEALTISVAGITLCGPNYEISGQGARKTEANITGLTNIAASGVTVNGLKFTGSANVKVSANNVVIANSYLNPTTVASSAGSNRKGVLVSGVSSELTGIKILNNYLNTPGTTFKITTESIVFDNVANCIISGNYITNSEVNAAGSGDWDYPGSQAMVRLYTVSGTLNVSNNRFYWGTYGYAFEIANNANTCTEINFIENEFNNNGVYATTAGINIRKGKTTTVTNVIGNKFYNVTGSTILATGDEGSKINVKYNIFGEGTSYKTGGIGSATLSFSNNYYALSEQTTSTSDFGTYTHDAAGLAKYEEDYADYLVTLE